MSVQDESNNEPAAPPTIDAPPPSDADRAVRSADSKPLTTDPDAPFGYMTDPVTKEVRPRKRPGRQAKGDPKPPPARSRDRKALPPSPATTPTVNYQQAAGDFLTTVWMLIPPLAALPMLPEPMSLRLRAQAAVLRANTPGLAQGLGVAAQNNEPVAKVIAGATTGEASWILPAVGSLIPFVAMSATMWRAPVEGDVTQLAKATDAEWDALVAAMMRAAQTAGDTDASTSADH